MAIYLSEMAATMVGSINIETVLTLLGVTTIATKANNNVDVEACFT